MSHAMTLAVTELAAAQVANQANRRLGAGRLLGTTVMHSAHISYSGAEPIPHEKGVICETAGEASSAAWVLFDMSRFWSLGS
jgi:hypothetical protein